MYATIIYIKNSINKYSFLVFVKTSPKGIKIW